MFDFRCEAEQEQDFINKLDLIKSYIKAEENNIRKHQYTLDLYKADLVNKVRLKATVWDYMNEVIQLSREEIDNKKKKERTNIDYLENKISEEFFNKEKIKIKGITQGGYECYHFIIAVIFNGKEYEVYIPNRKSLTVKNFDYAHEGKFAFARRTGEYSTEILFAEYFENNLAEKIKNYLFNS